MPVMPPRGGGGQWRWVRVNGVGQAVSPKQCARGTPTAPHYEFEDVDFSLRVGSPRDGYRRGAAGGDANDFQHRQPASDACLFLHACPMGGVTFTLGGW